MELGDNCDANLRRWFCGTINNTVICPQPNNISHELLDDICFINLGCAIFHVFFMLVLVITQGVEYMQTTHAQARRFLVKSPGHNIRWILSLVLLFVLLVSTAEGILTDRTTINDEKTSSLYLYIPPLCAMWTTCFAILLNYKIEAWQRYKLSIVLIFYWIFSCCGEILCLMNLIRLDLAHSTVVRFDTTVVLMVIYAALTGEVLHHLKWKVQVSTCINHYSFLIFLCVTCCIINILKCLE